MFSQITKMLTVILFGCVIQEYHSFPVDNIIFDSSLVPKLSFSYKSLNATKKPVQFKLSSAFAIPYKIIVEDYNIEKIASKANIERKFKQVSEFKNNALLKPEFLEDVKDDEIIGSTTENTDTTISDDVSTNTDLETTTSESGISDTTLDTLNTSENDGDFTTEGSMEAETDTTSNWTESNLETTTPTPQH